MSSLEALSSERNISYLNLDSEEYQSQISFFISSKLAELMDNYQILVTSYNGLVTEEGTPCAQYMIQHSEFLSSLQPNEFAKGVVAEVKKRYFSKQIMIGVHCKYY